ncbi:hypothetical protein EVAR_96585_1 [Eumeta japonica]|uniref:Uncharacterized protein n=1 Tax=Eumeta variegata TaxID=151549 RepID=A0A4C1WUT9_EUMVA|nr:hypothetical protein EVAR_96585_1 [Eumeta japonica]
MTPTSLPDARPLVESLAPAERPLSRAYKPWLDRHSTVQFRLFLRCDRSPSCRAPRVRVWVPRSVSRAAAVKPRASVPARSSGYPAVCTPSRTRFLRLRCAPVVSHPMPIAILVISRVFTRVNGFPLTAGFLVRESRTHPVRPGARTVHNGFLPLLALRTGKNTKKKGIQSVSARSSTREDLRTVVWEVQ